MGAEVEDPANVEEAMDSPQWKDWEDTLMKEYASLTKNGTWKLVNRPKDDDGRWIKVMTTKWVLKVKRDEHGRVRRYKARLVVHGYEQRFGHEYWKTYSPVVRWMTMLIVLLLALVLGLEVDQGDFETAFLNSNMDGAKIYVEQPTEFDDGTGRVCFLLKGLYGLKQAARLWYLTLHKRLEKLGMKRSAFDVGLYYKWIYGRLLMVTVYVNDMLIIGTRCDIDKMKKDLADEFALKDMGRVHYLLGMEVDYVPGKKMCISQTTYIDKILHKFQVKDAKTVRSPQQHNEKVLPIERDESKINDKILKYQELVGARQYLVTCTRPDISNAVRNLSRHTGSYTKGNFAAAKRVLRYLKGIRTYGLVYVVNDSDLNEGLQVSAYCDADHANCPDTSRSVTSYALQLNDHSFGFKSKMQASVTDDTCKSKLVAASTCVEDLLWAKKLLKELKFKPEVGKPLMDNQAAIKVWSDAGNFYGVKRYAKKSRKIAELVMKIKVDIEYVSTEDYVADMFTKALGPQRFEKLRAGLGVKDVVGTKERQNTEEGVIERLHDGQGVIKRRSVRLAKSQGNKAAVKQYIAKSQDIDTVVKQCVAKCQED